MINLHYIRLTTIVVLGFALRFWHLDMKPLWLDEILTAFFSFGKNYNDLPLDILLPIAKVDNIFTFKPEVSCPEIAHNLIIHSTHPPLFFCLIHSWINLIGIDRYPLAWVLRSLPALIGVVEIAAIYCLNRLLFSKSAALMAAALMAVSPFAVYLSQEARHYTLPMLLTTLALLGLIEIQHSLYIKGQRPKLLLLLFWGIVNSIGCYTHYFFILVFVAQILTFIGLTFWYGRKTSPPTPLLPGEGSFVEPTSPPTPLLPGEGSLTPPFPRREGGLGGLGLLLVILVILGVAVSYLPWISVILQTVGREETDWLPTPQHITPLFQLLVGWILMVIALPVEEQPLWIAIPMGLLMVGFSSWFGWQIWLGFQQVGREWVNRNSFGGVSQKLSPSFPPQSRQLATATLFCFTPSVLLQFLAIIYLLGKDISIAPRYNFVYYPAICALLAVILTLDNQEEESKGEFRLIIGRFKISRGGFKRREIRPTSRDTRPSSGKFTNGTSQTQPQDRKIGKLTIILPLAVSLLSAVLAIHNLVFLKPFYPDLVARNMTQESRVPLMMVMGYNNLQDVALGLSLAVAINGLKDDINGEKPDRYIVFLNQEDGYDRVWQKLADLSVPLTGNLNLWMFAPGLRRRDYPPQLAMPVAGSAIAKRFLCTLDSNRSYRSEISYRLYRCR